MLLYSCDDSKTSVDKKINSMVGDELRLAFLAGDISPYDIFIRSDQQYIVDQLSDLYELYQKQKSEDQSTLYYHYLVKMYGYPAFCQLPLNAEIPEELSLDNCEIITAPSTTEYSILLKYKIVNYDMYVGMDMWNFEDASLLSTTQWHPVAVYFIPESDEIMQPKVIMESIKIYYSSVKSDDYGAYYRESYDDPLEEYSWVLFYDTEANKAIYTHWLPSMREYKFLYNGEDKILVECDSFGFAVIDMSGKLYNKDNSYFKPYIIYDQNNKDSKDKYLSGSAVWIDANTLRYKTENGDIKYLNFE